ncbi:hypothetical protein E2C01_038801 [Portunus trituberculatus]|uniref:Uncharacterized protein n=1 Tax=Portunus trituberculatus TaxID=210409 RepID=A0A5B7FI44_PORTR|nr:hypothetical protein [Portunus trituberculatus]
MASSVGAWLGARPGRVPAAWGPWGAPPREHTSTPTPHLAILLLRSTQATHSPQVHGHMSHRQAARRRQRKNSLGFMSDVWKEGRAPMGRDLCVAGSYQ